MKRKRNKAVCYCCVLGQDGPNAAIGEEDRRRFVRDLTVKPGAVIKAESGTHTALVIREGVGKSLRWLDESHAAVTGFHYPSDVLELPKNTQTEFEAITRCSICEVDIEKAGHVLPDGCCFWQTLVEHGMRRIDDGDTNLVRLAHKPVQERVRTFLESLVGRPGATNGNPNVVWTPMRRDDIANYLGMQPETLSRAYSELARQGVISVRNRSQVEITGASR